ncbi:MAG: patatin-like phospholipase family protein [Patescibacteria group bacterium]|jgi:NTE family protein
MFKKVGLALGSGGVRGLAHIGVIKALLRHNIPIDYLSGASIGAWVAAHFALYRDIEKTAEFTVGRKKEKLLSFLEPTLGGGLVKGEKIEAMLDGWLDKKTFADVQIPLRINATDLISGEQVVFSEGNLAFAARASMAVPGIFRPVIFGNRVLVDGGVSNPVPDNYLKSMGAQVIIAVNLDFSQNSLGVAPQKIGFTLVAERTQEIMRHYLAEYSMHDADFIIQPPLGRYSSWREYFTKDSGEKIVEIGEFETEKIISQIKAKI